MRDTRHGSAAARVSSAAAAPSVPAPEQAGALPAVSATRGVASSTPRYGSPPPREGWLGAGDDVPAAVQRVSVRLPAALRRLADDRPAIRLDLAAGPSGTLTVAEVLAALRTPYPGVHHAVLDEQGAVRPHVNLFVGAENIRLAAGLATPVPAASEVWILPAVSGGGT